jgi:integrase/recombinase XerD
MIKRRAIGAGFSPRLCNNTFRATGITAYLQEGGTIEKAQAIACHESPKTTKLYDRTSDQIDLDEIERIRI